MKIGELFKNKFVQKIIESFFGKASLTVFSMLFSFVGARFYGAETFGEFSYVFALLTLLMMAAKGGMDNGLIYFIPQRGNRYITLSFLLNLAASVVLGLIVYIFTDNTLLHISVPAIWLLSAEQIFFGIYRSEGRIKEYFFTQGVIGLGVRVGLALVFYKVLGGSPESLVLSLIVSLLLSNGVFLYKQRQKFEGIKYEGEFLRYSLPMVVAAMMGVLMNKVDIVMLGRMTGSREVGIYQVASQLAGATSVLLMIFNTVFAPKISELYHAGEREKLSRLYVKSTRLLGGTALIGIGGLCILSPFILGFFGREFAEGQWALIYRAMGQFVNASVGSVWLMLAMTGKPKLQMCGNVGACCINVVLNLMLIPGYGIEGAAIASMAAVSFVNILGYIFVTRELRVKVYGIV